MTAVTDPLVGQRAAINQGADALFWDYRAGVPAPVKEGEEFALRSCRIRISRVHRARVRGRWQWRAEVLRILPHSADQVHLLGRSGGYTEDESNAIAGREDADGAGTLTAGEDARPPEPEAVPPDEIPVLRHSQQARAAYEAQQRRTREEHASLPLALRLASLRRLARERHVDISSEERVIAKQVARLERKILDGDSEAA